MGSGPARRRRRRRSSRPTPRARAAARRADAARGGRRAAASRSRSRRSPRRSARSSAPSRDAGRVAVAMSGGVDSAVALHRAGPRRDRRDAAALAGPCGARRGARVLLAGRRRRGARDVPRARPAARDARPARGVQGRGRRAVHATRTRRGRRRTRACAATARFASTRSSRSPSVRAPRSSGRATTRASSSATGCGSSRAARDPRRTSRTCSRPSIRRSSSACGSRSASRRRRRRAPRPRRAGWPRRDGAESQEACFLGGDDYRAFLERQGLAPTPGASRRRATARRVGEHDGYWRFTPGQRRGSGRRRRRARSTSLRTDAATNTVVVGPRERARRVVRRGAGDGCTARSQRGDGQAALPLGSRTRRTLRRPTAASRSTSTSRRTASRAARSRSLYDDDAVVGAGVITDVACD